MKTKTRRSLVTRVPIVPAEVQELESKQLLTGAVTVSVSANDDLTLTGDAASNNVLVVVNALGQFSVTGRNGTSVRFGNATTPAGTAVVLPISDLRDFTAVLGDGNDVLEARIGALATVTPRNVNVNTGAGADWLILEDKNNNLGPGGVSVSGNMIVSAEGGNDLIRLDIYQGLRITGSLGINAGAGNDRIAIHDQTKFNITANTVDGVRQQLQSVPNDTGIAGNQRIRAQIDINIFPETGADSVLLLGVESGRDILVDMNDSGGDTFLANNVRTGRNFGIANADLHALNNIHVVGYFGIRSGFGDDKVVISNMYVGQNIDIYLSSGDDRLAFGRNVQVRGSVLADAGIGSDLVSSRSSFASVQYKNFEGNGVNEQGILDSVIGSLLARGLFD